MSIQDLARAISLNKQLEFVSDRLFNVLTDTKTSTVYIRDKPKYIYIDIETSGKFLVDKSNNLVYSIKGYGVKNRLVGTIQELTQEYDEGNKNLMEYISKKPELAHYLSVLKPIVVFATESKEKFSAKGLIFEHTGGYDATYHEYVMVVDETATYCTVVKLGIKREQTGQHYSDGGVEYPDQSKIEGKPFKLKKVVSGGSDDNYKFYLRGSDKSDGPNPYVVTWHMWNGNKQRYTED